MRFTTFLTLIMVILFYPLSSGAQSNEKKGLDIAIEADNRDKGFGNFTAQVTMILKNRHGEESIRNFDIRTLEMNNDGDKILTIFKSPRDIRGIVLLTYSHKIDIDDQWLYLPALKRVKRISSANRSGSFMGSEFAYEDISSQEVEKYKYRWLRDEIYENSPSFVIERKPIYSYSGYTRQVV